MEVMPTISSLGHSVYPVILKTTNGSIGSINCYIINDGDSLTLIDAGIDTDLYWEEFIHVLKKNGFVVSDIDRILLTHHHEDHVGLVKRILAIKQIPVYAHVEAVHRLKMDQGFLTMRQNFLKKMYEEMNCLEEAQFRLAKLENTRVNARALAIQVDIIPLRQGDKVFDYTVMETPGHSPDSICFYDEKRKWLFSGDLLLSKSSTNAIIEPDSEGNRLKTVIQHRESLRKCASIDAELLFPGHQNVIDNHRALIETKIQKMDDKAERMISFIQGGIEKANDLAKAYYKSKYTEEFSLVMSEIVGYLDYLEESKRIIKVKKAGIWHYFLA